MRPFIVIGTPCFGGLVTHHYMTSVERLEACARGIGIDVATIKLGHETLPRGRSEIASMFMETPGATHLLFLDADISFDVAQVERMLGFDQPFVAGMYPLKLIDWSRSTPRNGESAHEACLSYVGELIDCEEIIDGFATGPYAGTGFQLIRRDVFERMFEAYPELKYLSMDTAGVRTHSPNRYALFNPFIDDDGVYLSEDYAFCKRWRAIGGKVWLDLKSKLGHHGSYSYMGNAEARFRSLVERKITRAA